MYVLIIIISLSNELDLDISSIEEITDEQYNDVLFLQKVHKLLFDVSILFLKSLLLLL